jgi:hypothetical protein
MCGLCAKRLESETPLPFIPRPFPCRRNPSRRDLVPTVQTVEAPSMGVGDTWWLAGWFALHLLNSPRTKGRPPNFLLFAERPINAGLPKGGRSGSNKQKVLARMITADCPKRLCRNQPLWSSWMPRGLLELGLSIAAMPNAASYNERGSIPLLPATSQRGRNGAPLLLTRSLSFDPGAAPPHTLWGTVRSRFRISAECIVEVQPKRPKTPEAQ